jgi:hypothetical protein
MKIEAVGANGRMLFDGQVLTISRKGAGMLAAINLGLQGDKVIPASRITAVELRPAGTFIRGYLRLSINGRDPVGGAQEAVRDENAVMLDKAHMKAFTALRDALLECIGSFNAGMPTGISSAADEIQKLAALKEQGLLTEEEFASRKRQLLNL